MSNLVIAKQQKISIKNKIINFLEPRWNIMENEMFPKKCKNERIKPGVEPRTSPKALYKFLKKSNLTHFTIKKISHGTKKMFTNSFVANKPVFSPRCEIIMFAEIIVKKKVGNCIDILKLYAIPILHS